MEWGKIMIRISILVAVLSVLGCSSKKEVVDKPGRYLMFTSIFPSGVYWKVIADFKATSDEGSCNSYSMNTGQTRPSVEDEYHYLKISGDTIRVPLFFEKRSSCNWELTDVSLQHDGERCMGLHALLLVDDHGTKSSYGKHKILPDTLDFDCERDSASGCYDCNEKDGEVNLGYRMPIKPLTTLFINLNFL